VNTKTKTLSLVSLLAIAFFALSLIASAVSPPPDGGYPGNNTAEGTSALLHLNGGTNNTAVGWASLGFNVTGNLNTAAGAGALLDNTADSNTATGAGALLSNTIAFQNTATGAFALLSNTTGSNNTAVGADALFSNADGFRNNAFGILALSSHQTGNFNNAVGSLALASDQTVVSNNAFGDEALRSNTTGTDNTAMGDFALHDNTIGIRNTAIGEGALQNNTTGGINTASGFQALLSSTTGIANTAIGYHALADNTSGSNNIALGAGAGANVTTATNVICVGTVGRNVSSSCFIGSIRDVQTQNDDAIPVLIDSFDQLGTISSSLRFKNEIKPMAKASESVLALRPVTFHYKSDKTSTPQFGLVAEEVAKVNPDLVVRDKEGKPYTVRYDQVNAMLLNEFLKEHGKVQELQATVLQQQKSFQSKLEAQEEQIAALASGLRKIDARFQLSRPEQQLAFKEP